MNKWKRIRPYVAFCAIALAVGGASSFATRAGMADFDLLTKPPAAPPDWLFPIAWTILYLLMGIAMGLVWRSSILPWAKCLAGEAQSKKPVRTF